MVQCLRGLSELKLSINIEDSTYLIHSVWTTALGRLAEIHSFISAVNFPGRAPALWIRIRQKNTYRVQFDNEALPIESVTKSIVARSNSKPLKMSSIPLAIGLPYLFTIFWITFHCIFLLLTRCSPCLMTGLGSMLSAARLTKISCARPKTSPPRSSGRGPTCWPLGKTPRRRPPFCVAELS